MTRRRKRNRMPRDPNRCDPTMVAHLLGCSYQRARNMMLHRAFGESRYHGDPPKLSVARVDVLAFIKKNSQATL